MTPYRRLLDRALFINIPMKFHHLLKLLFLVPLLCSCGQMGPLYLPGTPAPIHVGKEEQQPQPADAKKAEPTKPTPSKNQ